MQLSILQSLISRTRNEINSLHENVAAFKEDAKAYKRRNHKGDGVRVSTHYAMADKLTKQIVKLVVIQKALKREVYHTLLDNSFLKTLGENEYDYAFVEGL